MAAIAGIHSSGAPAGTILPCGNSTALPGTLLCQGQAVSRTTYAALFTAIGTTYGVGDGSTTFNLPDTRGIFLRGAGTNPSNASNTTTLGARQADEFKQHGHNLSDNIKQGFGYASGGNSPVWERLGGGTQLTASNSGTTAETRPANVGVNYCIAY